MLFHALRQGLLHALSRGGQQVDQLDRLRRAGLEALAIIAADDSEADVVEALVCEGRKKGNKDRVTSVTSNGDYIRDH